MESPIIYLDVLLSVNGLIQSNVYRKSVYHILAIDKNKLKEAFIML